MSHSEARAFWALRRAVGAYDPDEPGSGQTVTIQRDAASGMYEVERDAESYSAATDLAQALLALDYLDEGESVLIGPDGSALCAECRGQGCGVCHGSGASVCPPHRWPTTGVVV